MPNYVRGECPECEGQCVKRCIAWPDINCLSCHGLGFITKKEDEESWVIQYFDARSDKWRIYQLNGANIRPYSSYEETVKSFLLIVNWAKRHGTLTYRMFDPFTNETIPIELFQ